ncbi:hypothetical protein DB32_000421 [Sandaracinus amylolyticus]|uniref:Uncharacterized protein n=1 Tax=Sandaracinus amylolyticus TaxID=927083 RepID=A0A0F6YF63_9BACT|nr:hypothetical protein DB32_000421 [Sandaracinus amylolyticus]
MIASDGTAVHEHVARARGRFTTRRREGAAPRSASVEDAGDPARGLAQSRGRRLARRLADPSPSGAKLWNRRRSAGSWTSSRPHSSHW